MTPAYQTLVAALRSSLDVSRPELDAVLSAAKRSVGDLIADALTGSPEGVKRSCEACGGVLIVKSSRHVGDSQKQRVQCRECAIATYRIVARAAVRRR